MSPWTVLGWMAVCFFGSVALIIIGGVTTIIGNKVIGPYLNKMWKHYRTRRIKPEAGQRWMQDTSCLCIDRITDEGRIAISTHSSGCRGGFSDGPKEWKRRVKSRKLYLIQPRKKS